MLLVLFFAIFIQIGDCCCRCRCRFPKQLSIFSQIIEGLPQSMQWKITNELAPQFHTKRAAHSLSALLFMISLFHCLCVCVCVLKIAGQTQKKRKENVPFFAAIKIQFAFVQIFHMHSKLNTPLHDSPIGSLTRELGKSDGEGRERVVHRVRQRKRYSSLE